MLSDELKRKIYEACVEIAEDAELTTAENMEGFETTLSLPLGEGGADVDFTLTFELNASEYKDATNSEYLVISWWIPGNEMLSSDPFRDAALFPTLNELNQEPGIKCRIDLDRDRQAARDFIVIETDLLTYGIDRRTIVLALDRLLDFVSFHYNHILEYLTAGREGSLA